MNKLTLHVGGQSFCVPKRSVLANSDLFDLHPDLYDHPVYEVDSPVDAEECKLFIKFLETNDESLVTSENWPSLQALAGEFGVERLIELCSEAETAALYENLDERLLDFSDSLAQQTVVCESVERDLPRALCELMTARLLSVSNEVQLLRKETDDRFSGLAKNVEGLRKETDDRFLRISEAVRALRDETDDRFSGSGISNWESVVAELRSQTASELEVLRGSIRRMRQKQGWEREIPKQEPKAIETWWSDDKRRAAERENGAKLLDGIISYLTKRHSGNVHEKGIVTITSKSLHSDDARFALKNIADLNASSHFQSKDERGQWICWDFHEMRVCPTHYTILASTPKSWVVEGSMDGENWRELDRQTDTELFYTGSFAVANPAEARFVRFTQTGKTRRNTDGLAVRGVEFFGTLSE
jgi:hypothetical protein